MQAARRLIVVSNRGPVTYGRDSSGRRVLVRGGGGLVTAVRSFARHGDVLWIASATTDEDRAVAAEQPVACDSGYPTRLLAHDPAAYERFYNEVANPALWFAQHGLWELAHARRGERLADAWETGYTVVNRAFADAVCRELEADPDALVLCHDYHLYLVPQLVRERFPATALACFVHIPWPHPDGWNVLPERIVTAVHEGVLGADLVAFHSHRWQAGFLACAATLLGARVDGDAVEHAGRVTRTVVRPGSVDPAEFDALARDPRVLARRRQIRQALPGRIVLRVERTDPSKNLVRGLAAFERFLARHGDAAADVAMLALLDPSRQDIPEYAAYLDEVRRASAAIDARFGADGRRPVVLEVADDFLGSVAAYAEFDVLFVNPVADGLNLVVKEAPLVNERDGAVVLSRNAGAHDELGPWVVSVDPLDVDGQAQALAAALALPPAARRDRLEAMREHVRRHDLAAWAASLLADLERLPVAARR
ncbi:MAG TPA: trehalose-6-phosphate synthase [Gaiellaceae bacterium]|nr:trehalose-6-phosphate synthase [Gaiellaceae bacterium]